MRHRKLIVERSPLGLRDYADLYSVGEGEGPAPLVQYTGGTISREVHAARLSTEPTPIVAQLERALSRERPARVDVLISPSPPPGDLPREDTLELYVEYFFDVLLPQAGLQPPALAFIGYSLGGYFATYLAASNERCRALAVFGGAGVEAATKEAGDVVSDDLATRLYRNADDPVPDPARFVARLSRAYAARAMALRAGAHAFADYAANGTVADAFGFALRRVSPHSSARD